MADILTTAKVCEKAGLTYDGICIGLPDEYYKERGSYNRSYLENEITRMMSTTFQDQVEIDQDETIREYRKQLELD